MDDREKQTPPPAGVPQSWASPGPWYGQGEYGPAAAPPPGPQHWPFVQPDPSAPWNQSQSPTQPLPAAGTWAPPAPYQVPIPRRRRLTARVGIAAAAVLAVGVGLGVSIASRSSAQPDPVASGAQQSDAGVSGPGASGAGGPGAASSAGGSAAGGSGSVGPGWGGFSGGWRGGQGRHGTSGTGSAAITAATDAQQAGVVDIDVVIGGTEQAAGTGMVLTSTGEVLTNKHVVQGETNIAVTVPATGQTYQARVVGRSTTTDVAVVQITGASGLDTVTPATRAVQLGDAVVGVGNAGGSGGRPVAAAGTVTGLQQDITASDSNGSNPERLTGLIETDAPIQPGDSGGPLLNASNEVVGMDSAGSARGNDGYAIPIDTALSVAHAIEAGGAGTQAGAGSTATGRQRVYLGVQVTEGPGGVQVGGVVQGSPAANAGIVAGDTITSVAGHGIDTVDDLSAVMASLSPGERVTVTWLDSGGVRHSARVAPTTGRS